MFFDSALPLAWVFRRAQLLRLSIVAIVAGSGAACHTPGTPRIDGVSGAPANPATPWTVPAAARTPPPPAAPPTAPAATAALAADSATTAAVRFTLPEVVDIALKNNPTTRESWANAQAGANEYGAARGAKYPTINGSVNLAGASSGSIIGGGGNGSNVVIDTTQANPRGVGVAGGVTRAQITPALSLSYLVLDEGGRAATIESAKQNAIALNLAHNSAINDVVLQVESALFSYLANVALRDAQLTAVKEAQTDTANAEARLRVGVGTLQDVLQARTELAQARFQLVTLEGALVSSRATLAVSMGLPANTHFDIPPIAATDSIAKVAASVDTLINRAITTRPDLAEARATAAQLAAQIRIARSAGYPSLTLSTNQSYTRSVEGQSTANGLNASLVLGLQIPIFNGFSRQYDVRTARAQYQAALARVTSTQQQVTVQVFTSYAALQTARQRLAAAVDLLTAAVQSAEVAAGRYREGVGTIVDVVLARTALDSARAEDIQARWEWRTALAQLAHDVGSLDTRGRPNIPLAPLPRVR
ncbi:MAG TPA: TolC family protein [Gemmatimonadaceae bacterium]|jgi:outer membrane protein TolC|nr:TolC family protein [Gemmatimonadaceae bacterium]